MMWQFADFDVALELLCLMGLCVFFGLVCRIHSAL